VSTLREQLDDLNTEVHRFGRLVLKVTGIERLAYWLVHSAAAESEDWTKCPGCRRWLPANDWHAQRVHMESKHPDIIEERLKESARWDGWEND
jgi:hypothetical protein